MIVALVAACASLLVATIGLAATIVANRRSNKNAATIENLKHSLLEASKAREIEDSHLSQSVEGLAQGMQAIQNLKDEILLILGSIEDSLPSAMALQRVESAREILFDSFEKNHPALNRTEEIALHKAKNLAHAIQQLLIAELHNMSFSSELSPDARSRLTEFRLGLTESQNVLRDSRNERILRRVIGPSMP
ncbi:MAG TPA: hypothetical protein VN838_03255 [Bradyrhizobium sp.]|nr:hypothetical protein [Bradyrhizobium sp.]